MLNRKKLDLSCLLFLLITMIRIFWLVLYSLYNKQTINYFIYILFNTLNIKTQNIKNYENK